MLDAVELLKRVISPAADETAEDFDWSEIVAAIHALPSMDDGEVRELILHMLEPGPEIRLRPGSQVPHLMPPREMLRMMAIQMLGDDGLEQARPHLERIISESSSDTLRGVAQRRLRGR